MCLNDRCIGMSMLYQAWCLVHVTSEVNGFRQKEKISITLMFSDEALYKINKGSKGDSKPIS